MSEFACVQAIIIDSLDLTAERDAETVFQMGLKPTLLLSTHVHPDYFPYVCRYTVQFLRRK